MIRRVGSLNVRVEGSGGGSKVADLGTGRGFCGGALFLRGMRRGNLRSWSGLNDVGAPVFEDAERGSMAEGIMIDYGNHVGVTSGW